MTSVAKGSPDLSFLDDFERSFFNHQSAWWLLSPFDDPAWECRFGDKQLLVDFRIKLPDGKRLTSETHAELCNAIKTWLCLQTNPICTKGHSLNTRVAALTIARTLALCDYFILNWRTLNLGYHGFSNLTADNIRSLYADLNRSNSIAFSIYQWDLALARYLRSAISTLSANDIDRAVLVHPEISAIEIPQNQRITALTDQEIILSRCYLVKKKLLRQGEHPFKWCPATGPLSQLIYKDTLNGATMKPIPMELSFTKSLRLKREFPAKATRYKGREQSHRGIEPYTAIAETIRFLPTASVPVNTEVVELLHDGLLEPYGIVHREGRYATIPFSTGQLAVKRAIEFYLNHGDEILESYVRLAIASRDAPRSPRASASGINFGIDVENTVTAHVRNMGVKYWQLSHQMATVERPLVSVNRTNVDPDISQSFHSRYRSNEGLFELIKVLFGAIQVTVGVVTARRQAELCDQSISSALNNSGDLLLFDAGKTGAFDNQQRLGRPIPHIASRMLRSLERFQRRLVDEGIINEMTTLYARPVRHNFLLCGGATTMNDSFNWFCDYAELPVDADGCRPYIRQHQLRRHFAMAFFWGCSNGGIDTLRWFLGHVDASHVYHYITEAMPGTILNSAKAAFVRERVAAHEQDYAELLEALSGKFKVDSISLLTPSEIDGYLESLLEEKKVIIEPEFVSVPGGSSIRMLVILEGARYEL